MNKLVQHLGNVGYTDNGALTNKSTLDAHLDVFSKIGNPLDNELAYINQLSKCYKGDFEQTVRLVAYGRDILKGTGRRDKFVTAYKYLLNKHSDSEVLANALIKMITRGISYWKDAFKLYEAVDNKAFRTTIINYIVNELNNLQLANTKSDVAIDVDMMKTLCKWMPRKGNIFNAVRAKMKLTPKELRKLIVNNTNVVEQKMCANNWNEIDFARVPGRALLMYNKTFSKRDETSSRYVKYLESVKSGDVKINVANTVNAHEAFFKDANFAQASFVAMKEKLANSNKKMLVISDTSWSMNGIPMQVSISLAILFGSVLTGDFHNCCIPFSEKPRFITWKDTDEVKDIIRLIETGDVASNTNFQAVFDLILNMAVRKHVPKEDMPEFLLVLSDMQFDQAFSSGSGGSGFYNNYANVSVDNIELIKQKYLSAGYDMPQIIYWNISGDASYNNNPITKDDRGIMVSGYSQNIWKSLVENDNLENYNPYQFMLDTLSNERYDLV